MDQRTCSKCLISKTLSEFWTTTGNPVSRCKLCQKAARGLRTDKQRAYDKAYHKKHKEKRRAYYQEYAPEYYASNRGEIISNVKERYSRNRETILTRRREERAEAHAEALAATACETCSGCLPSLRITQCPECEEKDVLQLKAERAEKKALAAKAKAEKAESKALEKQRKKAATKVREREKQRERSRKEWEEKPEVVRQRNWDWYERNREKIKKKQQELARDPAYVEARRLRDAEWRKTDAGKKVSLRQQERAKERYGEDPIFRLKALMSSHLRRQLKRAGTSKKRHSTWDTLLYSPEDLYRHLEERFVEGMAWENYGRGGGKRWEIDHIKPMSHFMFLIEDHPEVQADPSITSWDGVKNPLAHPDVLECNALFNLRPMWATDNRSQGNRRVPVEIFFSTVNN